MDDAEKSAKFRQDATRVFQAVVAGLFAVAAGLTGLGWLIGRWWGLAIGLVLGVALLIAGFTAAGLIYAMTQDGA